MTLAMRRRSLYRLPMIPLLFLMLLVGGSAAVRSRPERHSLRKDLQIPCSSEEKAAVLPPSRKRRAVDSIECEPQKPRLITIRLARTHKDALYGDEGEIKVLTGSDIHLNLYGVGLNSSVKVKLTTTVAVYGSHCKAETESFSIGSSEDGLSAYVRIRGEKLPLVADHQLFYFCLGGDNQEFVHQGADTNAQIMIFQLFLPVWAMVAMICLMLTLSGTFSGLNLGLMALDKTELQIVQNTGTQTERRYANKIAPIRQHGNYLICTLVLGNVLNNSTLTIMLDTLTSGVIAVIGATLGIVIFGEIVPQAICSRHGLAVGAYTIWLTKFLMLLTFPLAYPISKLLDILLGAEIGTVYDKKRLIELLRVNYEKNDLEKEEIDIVTGALIYKDKKVCDVMTKLEDVYMLSLQSVLDFETVSDIRAQGYSRIPIFNGSRKNIVHIMFAKDLMFIDPDDKMPLAMVCEFYSNDVNFVFQDTPLNIMFNEFKSGDKGHMAFVQEINTGDEDDPFYETIGLVTLEDIIEEIIQQEIVDETDVDLDTKTKKVRKQEGWQGMEGSFERVNNEATKRVFISPQLALAVFQYLTTSIKPFKYPKISDYVLKRVLTMNVFREIKFKRDERTTMNQNDLVIISKGKVIDFFILIIEGRVEVNIGPRELVFESGPFTYFGIQALVNVPAEDDLSSPGITTNSPATSPTGTTRDSLRKRSSEPKLATPSSSSKIIPPFVPDYTVKAVTDVLYLRIKRAAYIAAIKASQINNRTNGLDEMTEGERNKLLEKILQHNVYLETTSPISPVREEEVLKALNPPLQAATILEIGLSSTSREDTSLELWSEPSPSSSETPVHVAPVTSPFSFEHSEGSSYPTKNGSASSETNLIRL